MSNIQTRTWRQVELIGGRMASTLGDMKMSGKPTVQKAIPKST